MDTDKEVQKECRAKVYCGGCKHLVWMDHLVCGGKLRWQRDGCSHPTNAQYYDYPEKRTKGLKCISEANRHNDCELFEEKASWLVRLLGLITRS